MARQPETASLASKFMMTGKSSTVYFVIAVLAGCFVSTALGQALFGYTEPIRIAQAAFSEAGILDALLVKEGDQVQEGDVLARLDMKVLEHDLNMTRESARVQEMRHAQIAELHKQSSVSAVEYERSRSDLLIAGERVQRILAQLDARALKAPFDGVIIRIFRERSEHISAARSEVLTIAQLSVLQVILHVPVDQVDDYEKGRKVEVMLENTHAAEATVVFVSPVIDAASRTVRVRLEIPNPEGALRAGMLCVPQSTADS